MLRPLLETLTRRYVIRRRLPARHGGARLYVSPSAGLKYLFRSMKHIDPTLCALAEQLVHAGSVVWDVGANIGLFCFAAAHHAGPQGYVVAFEPDIWLVGLLRRSSAQQPASSASVQIVPTAVAASCDLRQFNIAARSRAASFLTGYGSSQSGGAREEQTVIATSLDWLAQRLPGPDVLKIDVEGAELEVLKGAAHLLREKRPVLVCEVSLENSTAVTSLLTACGYSVYDGEANPPHRESLRAAPWTTVAIPNRSRGADLK